MLVWVVLLSLIIGVASDDSVVHIDDGPIRGIVQAGWREFKGIPFAQPPVGSLRWTDPLPNKPWSPNTLDATTFSAGCPQACVLPPHTCPDKQSEDCLYLNVFTPRTTSNDPLPVIVFLPGGRFEQGAAGTPVYEGGFFVNLTNVILVTSNYRLGALGWAVTDVLKGNYALKDQQMALRWVQKNIKAFGGNPSRVTLGGQSAGASSTACHLVTPSSGGLFQGAFMDSNPFDLPMKTTERAKVLGAIFSKDLGCDTNDFACFQSKSADEIVASQQLSQKKIPILHPLDLFLPWTPTVDGSYLPISPFVGIPNGNFHQVPIMMGTMLDDSLLFVYEAANGTAVSETDYLALLSFLFLYESPSVIDRYPPKPLIGDHDTRPLLSYLGDHYVFFCPNRFVVESMINIGASSPAYVYRFDHVLSFDPWGPRYSFCRGKVCHGSELPFLFHVAAPFYQFTSDEEKLSRDLISYYGNFAKNGNPNGNGLTFWPQYSSKDQVLLVNITSSVGQGIDASYCNFWDSIGYAWGT